MNLKARAIDENLKGIELAQRFNVSTQTVSKWLNRKAPVPDRHKAEFAALLKVRVEDLLPVTRCAEPSMTGAGMFSE